MQLRFCAERLHGLDCAPVGLHGEEEAGACRCAIDEHSAGAADAVLTPDVRPREFEFVAEKVAE
jgi:hypothetical protein